MAFRHLLVRIAIVDNEVEDADGLRERRADRDGIIACLSWVLVPFWPTLVVAVYVAGGGRRRFPTEPSPR